MCKIVQEGNWSGLVDNKQIPMLSLKNKDAKNIDIKIEKIIPRNVNKSY